jgi:uncharacterized protein (TIGR00725 family)
MARRPVVGVMGGGGDVPAATLADAERLGAEIARRGWVLLTGGRAAGVMEAASRGAGEAGGLVVGILPTADLSGASRYLDVAIRTGMGDARNAINVLSSDVVVALPGGAGTLSEVALAVKNDRPVVLFGFDPGPALASYGRAGRVVRTSSVDETAQAVERFLREDGIGG